MTVSTTTNSVQYTGNGSTTAFAVPYAFYASSDLTVVSTVIATGVDTTLALTTNYTVTGGSGTTGTVTMLVAPASTVRITITRSVPYTQANDFIEGNVVPADTLEASLDKATILTQQAIAATAQAIVFPTSDPSGLTKTIPSSVARASKVLAFDASGNVTVSTTDSANVILAQAAATTATNAAATAVAAVGAVKVTASDTTAAVLNSKIIAGKGVVVAVGNPAANETFTINALARVTTIASSATPTPNSDTTENYTVTALAAGATFGAPTGTPVDGQKLLIRVKDNGVARTLAFNAIYRAGTDVTLPTTTVISKTMYMGFVYNSADTKWDLVASMGNI